MRRFLLVLILISSLSCSTYRVTSEIDKGRVYSKFKKSGVIVRIFKNNTTASTVFSNTLSFWFAGYQKKNDLAVINDVSSSLATYESSLDRFYQLSNDNDFLSYKSLGVISVVTRNNSAELNKIIADNNLDSIIIYEVDGGAYPEMQFLDFDSMIVILDKNLEVAYMDHQKDSFEVDEYSEKEALKHLLDKISERFVKKMISIGYILDRK